MRLIFTFSPSICSSMGGGTTGKSCEVCFGIVVIVIFVIIIVIVVVIIAVLFVTVIL